MTNPYTTAAEVLHAADVEVADAAVTVISYRDPYGNDNSIQVGDRMLSLAVDDGVWFWTSYDRAGSEWEEDGCGTSVHATGGEAFIAITDWLRRQLAAA